MALSIQPPMRELVDRLAVSARCKMPDAESQMVEVEPSVLSFREPEDEAERSTGWRKVDLDAAGETGSIASFLVAGGEGINSLALAFQAQARFFADSLRTARRLAQILMSGQFVESDARKAPLDWHA